MKNKIQYRIQVYTQEVLPSGQALPYTTLCQAAEINHLLPFEEQIKGMQHLIEVVMRNLRKEHEKN